MRFVNLALVSAVLTGVDALLNLDTPESLNRYLPGQTTRVVAGTLETDPHGFIQVGEDGVMRSVAGNGTVIDYHQLDPDQLKDFAERQLHSWNVSTKAIPDDVLELATPPFADGRIVLEKDKLLHHDGIPSLAERRTSRAESSEVIEKLKGLDKRQACVGQDCETISWCAKYRPTPCFQCYFPRGPIGMCMLE